MKKTAAVKERCGCTPMLAPHGLSYEDGAWACYPRYRKLPACTHPIPLLDAKDPKLRHNNSFSVNARQTLVVVASQRIGQDAPVTGD